MSMMLYYPLFLKGIMMTILFWLIVSIISLFIGFFIGIISCFHVATKRIYIMVRVYTFIAKGIPAYVQILIAYFVIPALCGIDIPATLAAVMALSFCSSGYMVEIIRSGINAIPSGQWDAAFVLGYSMPQTVRYIILPQVIRNVLPSLIGELEQLLKSTSLFAAIGITELTRVGMNIISRELNPIPVYTVIALVYLFLSGLLQGVIIWTEKRRIV